MDPTSNPAHTLWVELVTRITTQRLHYRSGEEETAASSVHSLFKTVRELLEKYPGEQCFQQVALTMLNGVIRPYTARWRGWMTENKAHPDELRFRDEQARWTFRKELQELQAKLGPYLQMLAKLVHADAAALTKDPDITLKMIFGADLAKQLRQDQSAARRDANLGADVEAGIGPQVEIAGPVKPDEINRLEHAQINRRRAMWAGQSFADEEQARSEQPPSRTPSASRYPAAAFDRPPSVSASRRCSSRRDCCRSSIPVNGVGRRLLRQLPELFSGHPPAG